MVLLILIIAIATLLIGHLMVRNFAKIVPDEVLIKFMNVKERAGYEAAKANTVRYRTKEHIWWKYFPKQARQRVVDRISKEPGQLGRLMAAVVIFKVWG